MATRRVNPRKVKQHYSYTVGELAACLDVHKNTVRHWQGNGLEPFDKTKPVLFDGATVRAFLTARNKARKQPCPPGTIYCLRCRQPRAPAFGMVEFVPITPANGNLRALCESCETLMHRRVRKADIAGVMPDCTIQITDGQPSIIGKTDPSLNCDLEKEP